METDAMATSTKFDLSSGSPDRPLYTTGQRGSFTAASLDRSGSFREGMENPILSSLPSMSRNSSAVTQGEVVNFFQCLRFDPKLMAADHKSHRQGDLKRLTSIALGISPDDSSSGSLKSKPSPSLIAEEIKRVKAIAREISIKGREHGKVLNDVISSFNKSFPSLTSRKRSRPDVFANERSGTLLSGDRPVMGSSIGKMGTQSHMVTGSYEHEQQKSEERTKSTVPNKRTRTSLVDVRMDARTNALARPSGAVDRDREILRLSNGGAVQGEDRTLSIGVDGWEKSKMKKKRSGIKPDISPSIVSAKPNDGYREPKQGMQQRLVTDARSRLNNDSHGFRPGVANGAVGIGKADGISQPPGLGLRTSIPRPDQDIGSLLSDRRDRPNGPDKERVNPRAVNKTNVRDDFSSASPTSSTKMNASARAPRSSSGAVLKSSPIIHRSAVSSDWELAHCSNKPPAVGANNRKRTPSTRSSSPPVAHWAGQRPQKISRTARRTNFVPIVSSNDDTSALDSMSDAANNENGLGFGRRLANNSPQQVKLKGDHFSSPSLSETEESVAAEIKSRDKGKKSDETDEKAGQNVQKVSTLVLSSRKNKMVTGEDLGDGVRRQGRTGRGFASTRSLVPMSVEKLGNVGTAKQLRSARLGPDKTDSKAGRPPTRKLSDRKAYTRQRHTAVNTTADFLVGSDDGHEELLAAVNAVINPTHVFSSSFWRRMESFFGFVSDIDINYLKQEGNQGPSVQTPTPAVLDVDYCSTVPNGFGLNRCERDMGFTTETENVEPFPEQLALEARDHNVITLYQRLMAALISVDESDDFFGSGNEDLIYGTGFELGAESESNSFNHQVSGNFQTTGRAALNGCRIIATGRSLDKRGCDMSEGDIPSIQNTGIMSNFGHSPNGILSDQALMPSSMACSQFQYDNMSVENKLLMEIQSIGIYPEAVPDLAPSEDEEIVGDIHRLEDMYHGQVSKKKGLLGKLLKAASETRELQEKEFERHALDKLVGMAYEKYMSCWGPSPSGGKNSSSKMAKQAALAFVKRTLERCRLFENTGKSCFSEPLFKDMFISGSSRLNDTQSADTTREAEPAKPNTNTSTRSSEAKVSASMGSQQSPSLTPRFGQNLDSFDFYSPEALPSVSYGSEQTIVKEETWSNRAKKRELSLDEVVGGTSVIGNSLTSSAKGKRSERDREGKGAVVSRNGTAKIGRPSLSNNVKGERKTKSKPKQQKTSQVNGLLGKITEQPKQEASSTPKPSNNTSKKKDDFGLEEHEPLDLSHLQLPGMDVLGVPDDLDGQGQDLDSWLNIDEDGLQDHDFMGLEIPMDDLADLNMMV